ncbi:MAG: DNA topoisomerase VI, partial [Phycisphaerae bacterium]|nr:DNA topoisomerase VI [Phycisphaerae bacterium]
MAKTARNSKRTATATAKKIETLVDSVVTHAQKQRDPYVDIPLRTLSNVAFNTKKQIIEMGSATARRNFFDMNKAKTFMQTLLIASGCKQLVDEGKTNSIRGLYYMTKHSIPGTNEKTFDDQCESDPIIEDLEVALQALREELHVFASTRGALVGPLTFVDSGDTIDASRMGSGGYAIPSIVEPDIIQFKKCQAKFVLHVEKGTIWNRFREDRFWDKHKCILLHGEGQPAR